MSQIVKAIQATDTGNRRFIKENLSPLFQDVFETKSEIKELQSNHGSVVKQYRIGVTLGQIAMVDETAYLSDPDALTNAIDTTKRAVVEGIFGEFRPYFRRIELALANYDTDKARLILHELEDQMFNNK